MARKKVDPDLRAHAAALTAVARSRCIRRCVQDNGPLYVRAVVPDYAVEDWMLGDYSAWYVGHADPDALDQGVLNRHHLAYPDPGDNDGLSGFMSYLETMGYVVFWSAYELGTAVIHTGGPAEDEEGGDLDDDHEDDA